LQKLISIFLRSMILTGENIKKNSYPFCRVQFTASYKNFVVVHFGSVVLCLCEIKLLSLLSILTFAYVQEGTAAFCRDFVYSFIFPQWWPCSEAHCYPVEKQKNTQTI